jgi:hypothetical protein
MESHESNMGYNGQSGQSCTIIFSFICRDQRKVKYYFSSIKKHKIKYYFSSIKRSNYYYFSCMHSNCEFSQFYHPIKHTFYWFNIFFFLLLFILVWSTLWPPSRCSVVMSKNPTFPKTSQAFFQTQTNNSFII